MEKGLLAPLLIAGPCVIESEKLCNEVAEKLVKITQALGFEYVFKASFDKANRTSIKSYRGVGRKEGLRILEKIKERFGIAVTTDVHTVEDIKEASKVVDILQIPALLCRQTDLIVAAAQTGLPVNVKKGQFLSAPEVDAIAKKLKENGTKKYWITERGNSFGYQNLVVDMRNLVWMREAGHPVIFDATHSVQRPGGLGDKTGGDGYLAPYLATAAAAVGVSAFFIETHPTPKKALSDGPNMIPLKEMPTTLRRLKAIMEVIEQNPYKQ